MPLSDQKRQRLAEKLNDHEGPEDQTTELILEDEFDILNDRLDAIEELLIRVLMERG